MSSFTAFYDANVRYGSALRNFLMHLALTGLFCAKWSAGVHEEWMTALLRNRPDLSREKLERTRMLMDQHAEDALVTGYQDLIEGLHLPDPDDRHVLAAAIRGRADVIVTANVRDFPAEVLMPFEIEAQHPDEFVLHLLDLAPGVTITAAQRHRESLKKPAKTVEEYLEMLEREGLATNGVCPPGLYDPRIGKRHCLHPGRLHGLPASGRGESVLSFRHPAE